MRRRHAVIGWRHALLAGAALRPRPCAVSCPRRRSPLPPRSRSSPLARARRSSPSAPDEPRAPGPGSPASPSLAAVCGLLAGDARVAAIDRGAFPAPPGSGSRFAASSAACRGPQQGLLLVPVQTADGRLVVEAPPPDRDLRVGGEVRAEGVVREPAPWQAGRLADRRGVADRLRARHRTRRPEPRRPRRAPRRRPRPRRSRARARGARRRRPTLSRGFVLGQDDRIDAATVDDFRRSGLAHLLAVSGQNVLLLALLAMPVLALLGVPLRARLVAVIALIAIYVPVTGAGPSIQRAAVMGAAGIVAVLAGPSQPAGLRAPARRRDHARDQSARGRRRRLAAQLRRRHRHPALGAPAGSARPAATATPPRPCAAASPTGSASPSPRRWRPPRSPQRISRPSRSPRCRRTCSRCRPWRR